MDKIARPPTYQKYWLYRNRGIWHDGYNESRPFYESEAGRELRVIEFLRESVKPDSKALDVGCCYGLFSFFLVNHGCEVTGIDKDREVIEWCQEFGVKAGFSRDNPVFKVANLATYQPKKKFDIVLALALIHHLWRKYGLRESMMLLASMVAPGGKLYLEWISDLNKPDERRLDHLVRAGREYFKDMEILGITRNMRDSFRFMFRFTK